MYVQHFKNCTFPKNYLKASQVGSVVGVQVWIITLIYIYIYMYIYLIAFKI